MSVQKISVTLIALWLVAATVLAGCATTPTPAQNDENLLGQDVRLLYQQWGQPEYRSNATADEQQLHIWDIRGCKNNITTRPDGTIIGYAVTGDCP
ncbi:MAG: hypothetical protein ABJ000_08680 [Saccharospirillum sp.]|uniref:hypothetical protein n=1 Tax=Saccharospirillum sp. TaxID=2033801 RepID=UPI0032995E8C